MISAQFKKLLVALEHLTDKQAKRDESKKNEDDLKKIGCLS